MPLNGAASEQQNEEKLKAPWCANYRAIIEESFMTLAIPSEHADKASVADLLKGEVRQFVSFEIGNEEYAIDIMSVREIKGWSETTTLPNQPSHVRGVMNLRGTIVPVYDLRRRFGMGGTEASRSHVVIIVVVLDRLMGLLVDAVSDILTIDSREIRPVPETDSGAGVDFLAGIVTVKDSMVVILSLDKLLARVDITPALSGGDPCMDSGPQIGI